MVLVAVPDNRWGEDELAVKLGRVLNLNGRRNGLESQLAGILAETLADAPDSSVRIVARVLARIIVDKGVSVKTDPDQVPQEALYEALCWYLGVDGTTGGRRCSRAQTACVLGPSGGWRRSPPSSTYGPARRLRSGRWYCTVRHRVRPGRLREQPSRPGSGIERGFGLCLP
jgi:hypothetical protein